MRSREGHEIMDRGDRGVGEKGVKIRNKKMLRRRSQERELK